jgi:hypothetical protein
MILFNVGKERALIEHPARNHDDSFGSALERHAKMSLEERSLASGIHELRQIALRLQVIFNSMDDGNAEGIGKVVSDDADYAAAVAAERARKCIRVVPERLRNLANMLTRRSGYVLREWRIVENNGDRGHCKSACLGDIKQGDMVSEILLSVLEFGDDPPLRPTSIDPVLKVSSALTCNVVCRRCCGPGIFKRAQAEFLPKGRRAPAGGGGPGAGKIAVGQRLFN